MHLLTTLSLLTALAAPVAAPMPNVDPDKLRKVRVLTEFPVRLRMQLKVVHTTDTAEAGVGWPPNPVAFASLGNTEDEIYYTIAALPRGEGSVEIKTVRPSGDPDIWEMGTKSLPRLDRVLFEGELSAIERSYFAVAIGEQDNAQIAALGALFGDIPALVDAMDGPDGQAEVPDSFEPGARAAVERIRDKGDDIVGYFLVTVGGGLKLDVEGSSNTYFKVISQKRKEVKAELNGRGARYELRIWVEDTAAPVPKGRKLVGTTIDQCGENDLWVHGDAGQVLVKKGETKTLPLGAGQFTWYCDGSEESSVADSGTDLVTVRRASEGRKIFWRFFREDTLTADFKD